LRYCEIYAIEVENGMQDAAVVYTIVINSTEYMSQRGYDRRLLVRGRVPCMIILIMVGQKVGRKTEKLFEKAKKTAKL
jgi:hypothetical protein